MSRSFDLDPAERFTAGATGEPGLRTFFVQGDRGGERCTILAEKGQVAILAQALMQLVDTLSESPEGVEPSASDLDLAEPLEPQWRAGEMSIHYDDDADRITVLITEMRPEEGEEDDEEPGTARFVVSRAQARGMAGHTLAVVAAGRPRCQFCGSPMDPEVAHMCPTMNGHRSFRGDDK